ncbi:hypothetical protein [Streptomyces violascens]|uniref:hypothetical protein n=1 Tax=Streptomyces violascens TaxID=67381 RepID=UPI00365A8724
MPRDREAERSAIQAAADRLLAGAPLHSVPGKLNMTALITECGLRRDVVYQHRGLVEDFKARAMALEDVRAELVQERETSAHLKGVVAELANEPGQATSTGASPLTPRQRRPRQDDVTPSARHRKDAGQ